ncbi:MAG: tetratricopeptide repeat protein [Alphaproteobacteria bacterium]|nr:tetratricopeptide repeat protein [Alphaproteobacteria bacterium]
MSAPHQRSLRALVLGTTALFLWGESHLALAATPAIDIQSRPLPPVEHRLGGSSDQTRVDAKPAEASAASSRGSKVKVAAAVDSAMKSIFGVGTDQNYGLALKHLNSVIAPNSKASPEDRTLAKTWLGLIYYNGWGVKPNTVRGLVLISEALPRLIRSAEAGTPLAQMSLGRLYRNGQGVAQDFDKAREWLGRAAAQGSAAANLYLGYMDQKGMGGEVNLKQAMEKYKLSASAGNSFGAYYLSQAYGQGWDGTVDAQAAKLWLNRAMARRNPEALRAAVGSEPHPAVAMVENSPATKAEARAAGKGRSSPAASERIIELARPNPSPAGEAAPPALTPAASSSNDGQGSAAVKQTPRKPLSLAARRSFDAATSPTPLTAATAPENRTTPPAPEARAAPPASPPSTIAAAVQPVTQPPASSQDELSKTAPSVAPQLLKSESIAELIRKSDQGDRNAALQLAMAYQLGNGVQQDIRRAASLYRQLAEVGNPEAQNRLGVLYGTGQGVELNYQIATAWYRQASAQNHPAALYNLAVMIENGWGGETPAAMASQYYSRAAELGYGQAQMVLAKGYATGKGFAPDSAEAAKWLRRAADTGLPDAQYQLGSDLRLRAVSEAEEEQAIVWIRRAALQGHTEATVEIRQRDAAARGDPTELFRLGARYYSGEGVVRNLGRALSHWRKATVNGSSEAAIALARLYATGETGEVDVYRSAVSLFVAERLRGNDAELKQYLLPRLTKKESEKAQEFADGWKIGNSLP